MIEVKQQTPEEKDPKNLDELFMLLFSQEYLDQLPPEVLAEIIDNLKSVEATFEIIPPEWVALKNTLTQRGFLP